MNTAVLKTNLKEGINIISGAHKETSHLPVLKNFLISTINNSLKITSTDLEIVEEYIFSAKIISEGTLVVPFSVFSNIISNLSLERVNLEQKGSSLLISSENYNAKITTINKDEYPIIPVVNYKPEKSFIFDTEYFIDALATVSSACQPSDIRPELNGICFIFNGGELKMVATDSFRLAEKTIPNKKYETQNTDDISRIIPLKTIQEAIRIFGYKKDGKITVFFDQHQVLFKTEHITLTSRLIQGKFPDYQSIIPLLYATEVVVKTSDVVSAIKLASTLSNRLREVSFVVSDTMKHITISSASQEFGESECVIPTKTKGEKGRVTFNWRFLLDGVKNIKTENIFFGFNGEDKPSVVKTTDDPSFVYVIMPIKSA